MQNIKATSTGVRFMKRGSSTPQQSKWLGHVPTGRLNRLNHCGRHREALRHRNSLYPLLLCVR